MTESKHYASVVDVIANQLRKKPETIKATDRVVEDLSADSLDVVEMLMALEEDHGIVIPDDEAAKLKTVADIAAYLDSHPSSE